jgi:hypothetical protein
MSALAIVLLCVGLHAASGQLLQHLTPASWPSHVNGSTAWLVAFVGHTPKSIALHPVLHALWPQLEAEGVHLGFVDATADGKSLASRFGVREVPALRFFVRGLPAIAALRLQYVPGAAAEHYLEEVRHLVRLAGGASTLPSDVHAAVTRAVQETQQTVEAAVTQTAGSVGVEATATTAAAGAPNNGGGAAADARSLVAAHRRSLEVALQRLEAVDALLGRLAGRGLGALAQELNLKRGQLFERTDYVEDARRDALLLEIALLADLVQEATAPRAPGGGSNERAGGGATAATVAA